MDSKGLEISQKLIDGFKDSDDRFVESISGEHTFTEFLGKLIEYQRDQAAQTVTAIGRIESLVRTIQEKSGLGEIDFSDVVFQPGESKE